MEAMVAMNSIPQQEVAKGNGQSEFGEPYLQHHLELWQKNPPTTPSGGSTIFMLELLIVLYFELENLNHEPYKLILIQCL
jgi:hypothetical protein